MAYKLGNYKGCGSCVKKGACKNLKRKKVVVRFKNNERADNWGRTVTVFRAGEEVKAEVILDNETVLCATAESKRYDYQDFISLENIEIV